MKDVSLILPRAVLRIGVVGRRFHQFPPKQLEAVAALMRTALLLAGSEFKAAVGDPRNVSFFAPEQPLLRVVTVISDDADLMAAQVAGQLRQLEDAIQWSVEVVLPARREALIDALRASVAPDQRRGDVEPVIAAPIAGADLVVELPERQRVYTSAGPSDATGLDHQRASEFLLRQSDMLIAVWDGLTRGAPDETVAILHKARASGIPILLIDPAGVGPVRLDDGRDEPAVFDSTRLRELIGDILLPPVEQQDHAPHRPGLLERFAGHPLPRLPLREKLAAFLAASRPPDAGPQLYERVASLLSGGQGRSSREWPDIAGDWRRVVWDKAHRDGMAAPHRGSGNAETLSAVLLPRFCLADDLARYNANRYRSAYIAAYLLSALAVLIAVLGFTLEIGIDVYLQKAILAAVELGILATIAFLIVMRGETGRWHEKWIDYRALAEALRHQRFLALIGEYGHLSAGTDARRPWWLWYVQATIRAIGMPSGHLDAAFQKAVLGATRRAELLPQLDYHRANRDRLQRLDHALHLAGYTSFWAATAALFLYLVVYLGWLLTPGAAHAAGSAVAAHGTAWLTSLKVVVGVLAAVLPAFGAAIAGIRYTGEFEGSASRSEAMIAQLEELVAAFERAEAHELDFEATRELLTATAEVLTQDQDAFWQLYERRRLTLPG